MILDLALSRNYEAKYSIEKIDEVKAQYSKMKYGEWNSICYIQKGKKEIRENSVQFIKENNLMDYEIYPNIEEATEVYQKYRR
jgi:hypothetical protein